MNEIRKRIVLAAPLDRVWQFLTEPARIAEWLMESTLVDVYEGSEFMFTAEPSGRWDGRIHCTIREVIEKERISYTWNANDVDQVTVVTFDLEAHPEGTELVFTHSGFDGAAPGAAGRTAAAWT
ncbi:MAG: SRPBCC domain-containing protein, partial [Pseudomonadales bacterium]|nr:SRPBCC domain-containing protein [Pseudomonadales bacterium]